MQCLFAIPDLNRIYGVKNKILRIEFYFIKKQQ